MFLAEFLLLVLIVAQTSLFGDKVASTLRYVVSGLAVALFLGNLGGQLASIKQGLSAPQAWLRAVLPLVFGFFACTIGGFALIPLAYGLLVGVFLVEMVANLVCVRDRDDGVAPAGNAKITIRAVVVGLLLGSAAAGVGIINDFKLQMSQLNVGHFPVIILGVIILSMMLINPQLSLLERVLKGRIRLRLVAFEWAVILAISCVAVPVMQQIGHTLPALSNVSKHYSTNNGWVTAKVLLDENNELTYLPKNVIFRDGQNDEHVATYVNGPPPGTEVDSAYMLAAWQLWAPVLTTWLPIMVLFFVALIALTLVIHRQWATREHIRFPIADFISTVVHGRSQNTMESATARRSGSLFRTPAFWIFFGALFGLHLLNGMSTMYFPTLPKIPLTLDMHSAVLQKFPELNMTMAWKSYQGLMFPTIIAFSFFLAREVSLGLGLTPMIHEIYTVILITSYDINPSEASEVCWGKGFFNMGAILAIALSILWLGRSYYFPLIAQALGAPGRGGRRLEGVWAMRAFLVCITAVIVLLSTRVQIDWQFAIIFIVVLLVVQVVTARINAETGLFIFGLSFFGNEAIIAVLGFEAMGPRLAMLSSLFMIIIISSHTAQPLAPIAINSLEVCRRQKVNVGRVGVLAGVMIVLAFVVATYVSMDQTYKNKAGANGFKTAASTLNGAEWPLRYGYNAVDKGKTTGKLEESVNKGAWERLSVTNAKPVRFLAKWFFVGFIATVVLTFLRLRFTWWPIHPVVMAVWGSWFMAGFGFSFLIGWALRSALSSLFGEAMVEKAKPAMVGVIAGELVAAAFWLGLGWANTFREVPSLTPHNVYAL